MLYRVVEDHTTTPTMFGLAAPGGYCMQRISTDSSEMERLAQTLNRLQLSPIHFYEIVEDFRKS